AVAARRALADTDEALSRLASGRYGLCEGCAAAIPAWLLTAAPDARFCPRCQPPSLPAAKGAVWSTTRHGLEPGRAAARHPSTVPGGTGRVRGLALEPESGRLAAAHGLPRLAGP